MRSAPYSQYLPEILERPRVSITPLYWFAALILVIAVPTAFWTIVLVFGAKLIGIAVSTFVVVSFAVIIGALCFVSVAILTSGPR
jgi:hypothetical protein